MNKDKLDNLEGETNDFFRDPAELKIGDLLPERPKIGDDVPVILWRLVRLIGMHQILGEETETVLYFVGKKIGKMMEINSIRELENKLVELKIGEIKIAEGTEETFHLSIAECITCAGIKPPLGKPICQLEAGIVAGVLEYIHQDRKVVAKETKCIGGLGDEVCLIECQIV